MKSAVNARFRNRLGAIGRRLPGTLGLTMSRRALFADVLDAAEQLDDDAQAELVAVLSRRLAERGRERVAASMAVARREFAAGQCQVMTAPEMVREARAIQMNPR